MPLLYSRRSPSLEVLDNHGNLLEVMPVFYILGQEAGQEQLEVDSHNCNETRLLLVDNDHIRCHEDTVDILWEGSLCLGKNGHHDRHDG